MFLCKDCEELSIIELVGFLFLFALCIFLAADRMFSTCSQTYFYLQLEMFLLAVRNIFEAFK